MNDGRSYNNKRIPFPPLRVHGKPECEPPAGLSDPQVPGNRDNQQSLLLMRTRASDLALACFAAAGNRNYAKSGSFAFCELMCIQPAISVALWASSPFCGVCRAHSLAGITRFVTGLVLAFPKLIGSLRRGENGRDGEGKKGGEGPIGCRVQLKADAWQ
jgi:hypothetical protein